MSYTTPPPCRGYHLPRHSADGNSDGNKKTALHLAAEHGHLDIVSLLVAKSADVNCSDRVKKTPLHLAAEHGRSDIVRSLVEHNTDVNSRDRYGKTALDLAAERGHSDIESFLRAQEQLRDTRARPSP
ncbi:ankyrin repeat-containing domain protein [Mycena epipterygia]|nr:ankyrin repeat-containing domain protein [Mycena epipterygia]